MARTSCRVALSSPRISSPGERDLNPRNKRNIVEVESSDGGVRVPGGLSVGVWARAEVGEGVKAPSPEGVAVKSESAPQARPATNTAHRTTSDMRATGLAWGRMLISLGCHHC